MTGPLVFSASNTHLPTGNPKFWTEIEPECGKCLFFFGFSPKFGVKFQNEIELFSLT